ncbi:exported hypothetical protein [Arthrobacter sp. 9V]|nr:exported hypothetical protein [Arthrobacter sp. 9V]
MFRFNPSLAAASVTLANRSKALKKASLCSGVDLANFRDSEETSLKCGTVVATPKNLGCCNDR